MIRNIHTQYKRRYVNKQLDIAETEIKQIFEDYGKVEDAACFIQTVTGDALRERILERAQNESEYGAVTEIITVEAVSGKEIRIHVNFVIEEDEDGISYIYVYGCYDERSS